MKGLAGIVKPHLRTEARRNAAGCSHFKQRVESGRAEGRLLRGLFQRRASDTALTFIRTWPAEMAGTPVVGERGKRGYRYLAQVCMSSEMHAEGMLPANFHSVVSRAHDQDGASNGGLPLDRD